MLTSKDMLSLHLSMDEDALENYLIITILWMVDILMDHD